MYSSISRRAARTSARPTSEIPTVCIVDPEAHDYEGWDSLAKAGGLQFKIVASAEEALRFSRTTAVDLWVVNTNLPGLSGCELCSMLRSRSPVSPVYLVADQYSVATEQKAWAARATMFGVKPAHTAWLHDWVQSHSPHSPSSQRSDRATAPVAVVPEFTR